MAAGIGKLTLRGINVPLSTKNEESGRIQIEKEHEVIDILVTTPLNSRVK